MTPPPSAAGLSPPAPPSARALKVGREVGPSSSVQEQSARDMVMSSSLCFVQNLFSVQSV